MTSNRSGDSRIYVTIATHIHVWPDGKMLVDARWVHSRIEGPGPGGACITFVQLDFHGSRDGPERCRRQSRQNGIASSSGTGTLCQLKCRPHRRNVLCGHSPERKSFTQNARQSSSSKRTLCAERDIPGTVRETAPVHRTAAAARWCSTGRPCVSPGLRGGCLRQPRRRLREGNRCANALSG
jgi:hypothetical protein